MSSDEPETTPVDAEAPEQEPQRDQEATPERGAPRWLVLGSAAFAVAAFVVAAAFGVMWWTASADDSAAVAREREDVVRAAGQAVTAFTELDHENLDAYFNRQKEIATGELRDQITQAEQTYRKAISEAKTKVTTTVQDVAVNELNEREGKASALATASTNVTRGQEQGTKTMRLEIQLTRVDEGGEQVWKVSQIGDVPVAATGQQ